jgi:hypothetical protein
LPEHRKKLSNKNLEVSMPVKKCSEGGKPGYKCGDSGKCYTYSGGNERSRKNAKRKAILQCRAMDEPISEADWEDAFINMDGEECCDE